ncbi:hypothetical protein [Sphingomonas qomolangmaensis]|uniref:Uncharacterized protein n=1 Tax=Sphingomonas qomolangmaensis TaxID=2918765 RepID=A0ABY5LAJ1_9SPHN|nr:hypothetical protein [Sphingomonas qomolangmaensis]UUL83063.1 hypothetical protein NMP03_02170 [Sphingomonas qomolangmaensis]
MMTEVPLHPSVMADDETSLEATREFFVKCGLMKEGDRFVVDEAATSLTESDVEPDVGITDCESTCTAAYEIAKLACAISGSSSCKRRAKAAYQVCLLACG